MEVESIYFLSKQQFLEYVSGIIGEYTKYIQDPKRLSENGQTQGTSAYSGDSSHGSSRALNTHHCISGHCIGQGDDAYNEPRFFEPSVMNPSSFYIPTSGPGSSKAAALLLPQLLSLIYDSGWVEHNPHVSNENLFQGTALDEGAQISDRLGSTGIYRHSSQIGSTIEAASKELPCENQLSEFIFYRDLLLDMHTSAMKSDEKQTLYFLKGPFFPEFLPVDVFKEKYPDVRLPSVEDDAGYSSSNIPPEKRQEPICEAHPSF